MFSVIIPIFKYNYIRINKFYSLIKIDKSDQLFSVIKIKIILWDM